MKKSNLFKRILAVSVVSATVLPAVAVPAAETFAEETASVSVQASEEDYISDADNTGYGATGEDPQPDEVQPEEDAEEAASADDIKNDPDVNSEVKETMTEDQDVEYGGGQEASKKSAVADTEDQDVENSKDGDDSKNGWGFNNGKWSYVKDGEAYTGWHYMSAAEGESIGHWSYFGSNGVLRTGWVQLGKGTSEPDGNSAKHWSYFGDNGWLRTGWVQLGKGTSEPDGNSAKHWSYFGDNGWLRSGWVQLGKGTSEPDGNSAKHWSYFGDNGWLRTNWVQLGKGTAEPDGNSAKHWSYFGPNGWLRTGWQKMGTGTDNPDGNASYHISYFGDNGWLVTGSLNIDGVNCTFDQAGWLSEKVLSSYTELSSGGGSDYKISKVGNSYALWDGSSAEPNADVWIGNARIRTNASGIVTSVDYEVKTWVNQLNYYGCYPMACGAAASFMALQANGYALDLSGKSGWDSYIAAFRSVRGSSYGKRYGNGVMTAYQIQQCIKANSKTSNVPMTALSGNDVTLDRIKDSLAHGQTVTAVVKLGSSTHWIAVTGWYMNGNTTVYKIADPWPKDGKSSTNYVSSMTRREDGYYSDRLSASDLQSILKASSIYSYHNGGQILLTGNYR